MRRIKIVTDNREYQKWLTSPQGKALGRTMDDAQIANEPEGVYILTGDKTVDFGGGPSPYGFLMRNSYAIVGRVNLAGKRGVTQGFLEID